MQLKKVTINNFRNIEHQEYELDKINIFAGPNRIGKTNTIIAIYWAITGYLLDGSSDHASLKPLSDTRAEVSVELEFDTFKLKKVFYENWVKNRGTKEETMSGHITEIYINDIHVKNTDAIKTIASYFNVDNEFNTSKFDLLQAIINPYYISKVDWKELRKFIIALIGDVSNEDVFQENDELLKIKDRLEVDDYDTAKTNKFFAAKIKECKDTVKEVEGKIKGLQDIHDVSDVDYNQAKMMIDKLNEQSYAVKNDDDSGLKEAKSKLNEELIELQEKYQFIRKSDQEKLTLINKSSNEKINNLIQEVDPVKKELNQIKKELIDKENIYTTTQTQINRLKLELGNQEDKREQLYQLYDKLNETVIEKNKAIIDVITCPNCNHVLNQDAIEKANEQAEQMYQKALDKKENELAEIIAKGKATKQQIEKITLEIQEKEKQSKMIENEVLISKKVYNDMLQKVDALDMAINAERNNIQYQFESEESKEILIQINNKQKEIELLSTTSQDIDKRVKLAEIEQEKEQYQKIINDKNMFLNAQELIKKNNEALERITNNQIQLEQFQILVNTFILTKLNMFNNRISEVFGDRINFTLIENNIKEGSWNEVCYPSVLDKQTPLNQGSGSEQILTGIYLIECATKKLGIKPTIYIFDECDKLDTKSLANIETQAQLVSTRVDDINYQKVTLEKRG